MKLNAKAETSVPVLFGQRPHCKSSLPAKAREVMMDSESKKANAHLLRVYHHARSAAIGSEQQLMLLCQCGHKCNAKCLSEPIKHRVR